MFNLLISANDEAWDLGQYSFEIGRFTEYTEDLISKRYKHLTEETKEELKAIPTLFVIEQEVVSSRVGFITDIKIKDGKIVFNFEIDKKLKVLPKGKVKQIGKEIGLGDGEIYRTHWAIKDADLLEVLIDSNHLTREDVKEYYTRRGFYDASKNISPEEGQDYNFQQIFIVHGHDDLVKTEVKSFVESLGLEPIILHLQPSAGRTIIEKIEQYSNVGFAIVLYTPCDVGAKRDSLIFQRRARQNVVFEHGYLIAKLGRDKVVAVVKGDIEKPNDISGVVYVDFDEEFTWKTQIEIELKNAEYILPV